MRTTLLCVTACILFVRTAAAGEHKPEHTHCRAGYPCAVAPWARPSVTRGYEGGYVGGGAAVKGDCRYPSEGTWGWDYRGKILPRKVFLGWWHGRKYQGGIGAYTTDAGPNVPPPPILRKF